MHQNKNIKTPKKKKIKPAMNFSASKAVFYTTLGKKHKKYKIMVFSMFFKPYATFL